MCLAVPGELIGIEEHDDPLWRVGQVSFAGVLREVSLACVPEARLGDLVLVHVGFALGIWQPGDDDASGFVLPTEPPAELP
ncbi:HypC/HybG/HupF family hydrogenase formation chaperone [Cyanobium sp. Morenito 9A2]|uniref:HypC/HybG/HupF family hydrogenase formation chaperone n=1 Tax=Cyanobium sp. Morenito 9A2 TaxID=2823718 RepID=UPI0020CD81B3|nr:HypC/HybG/HupF family hydrogenase formation chaperone [Cyanobium sp. Morenito 9A2]MCP9848834.1 HypC/HybG/HupF family hydrogenase formation chaperone [Cyanobium sp. Morenito 9A2]